MEADLKELQAKIDAAKLSAAGSQRVESVVSVEAYNDGLDTAMRIFTRFWVGRAAVRGKPPELMNRDELLALVRDLQASQPKLVRS